MAPELDAFGLPLEDQPVDEEEGALMPDSPEAGEESPEVQPEELQETPVETEAPEVEVEAAPVPAEQDVEPAIEEEAPRVWAKKYNSPDDLERGYGELRDLWRRTSERATALEQQNDQLVAKGRELESTLRELVPFVQQWQAQQAQAAPAQPQEMDEYGRPLQPVPPTVTPQQVQAYVDKQMAEREQALQARWAQEQAKNSAVTTVKSWFEEHPEVGGLDSEGDNVLYDTAQALNEAWRDGGYAVDVSNPETLDIVYEASKRPALLQVLSWNSELTESDAGMQYARAQAAMIEGVPTTVSTQQVPASQVGQTTGQKKPVVEKASGGATPAQGPVDDWEEAKQALRGGGNEGFHGSVFE